MDERDVIMLYIQVGGALLVSAITGVMGALVREVWALRKERQEKAIEEEAERGRRRKALKALLKFQLHRSWQYHTGNGFMPANEMSLQTELYEAYHDMGGNGTGTKLYNEMMELPHIKHTEVK